MLRFKVIAVLCLVFVALTIASACAPRFTCIAEGTLVRTPDGEVPIESIKIGSRVVTGGLSGKHAEGTVMAVLESTASIIQRTTLEDGWELCSTPEHPIATPDGFRKAGSLAVGDEVVVADGTARISRIDREKKQGRVFDLSVEPGNTFFAAGVLVHNKTIAAPPTMRSVVGRWIGLDISNDWALVRYWLEVRTDGTVTLTSTQQEIWMQRVNVNTEVGWKRSTLDLAPASPGATTATLKFVPLRCSFRAQFRSGEKEPWREVLFLNEDYVKTLRDRAPSNVPQQQVQ